MLADGYDLLAAADIDRDPARAIYVGWMPFQALRRRHAVGRGHRLRGVIQRLHRVAQTDV